MKEFLLKYLLPGIGMFILALFAGSHKNAIFGMLGFVSFFTVGVFLVVEGRHRCFQQNKNDDKK